MDTPEPFTPSESQELFLELVAAGLSDSAAAADASIHRVTAWRWRQDPAFLERYKAAKKVRLEQLVAEAERRAMSGSDRLLEFLLCNYAPDKFSNKQKVEHGGGVLLNVSTGVPFDDGTDLVG